MNHNEEFYSIVQKRISDDESRLNALLNPRPLACDYDAKTSTISYRIQPWQRNPYGDAHGGAIASMFDTSMGITAHWISGGFRTTTVDLMVNYIAPMPCGDDMIVHSKVQKAGRTLIRVTAEAKSASNDTLIATASANFMILR